MILRAAREYFHKNKGLANIFLVYFFLTFAIGYIDFDRRVDSFDVSVRNLEMVYRGEFTQPMAHRILIPYLLVFFHKATGLPLDHTYALFRFIFYYLSFVLFHLYLKIWFDDKLAMIGTLSLIAALPLTLNNWYCIPTDMPELITFILAAAWIKYNKYRYLLYLIPIASLNRETTLALILLYFLNGWGRQNSGILLKRTVVYFSLWLIPSYLLVHFFGYYTHPSYFHNLIVNSRGLLQMFRDANPYNQFYFLLYFFGFYWVLAFRDFSGKDPFLKRSVPVMLAFFLYAFIKVAGLHEVRIFVPFSVFIIPLGLFSLFGRYSPGKTDPGGR